MSGCTTYGSTPTSNSPTDIVTAIKNIYTNRYNTGYSSGQANSRLSIEFVTTKASTSLTIRSDAKYFIFPVPRVDFANKVLYNSWYTFDFVNRVYYSSDIIKTDFSSKVTGNYTIAKSLFPSVGSTSSDAYRKYNKGVVYTNLLV